MSGREPREWRDLFRRDPHSEVQDELEFHLEQRMREYMAEGMDEESARRTALERIGDINRVRGECTDLLVAERRANARQDWLSDLRQDVGFALAASRRAPLFSLMAIVTLALGIGANSAVFGVVKSVLLDALPYAEPERLVRVHAEYEAAANVRGPLSAGTVQDIAERQQSFTAVAGSNTGGPDAVLQSGDGAVTVRLSEVQPAFFEVLGVSPALGRTFTREDAALDTAQVALMTHEAWQQRFGGTDGVLGSTIVLNGLPRTVIGILPPGFVHPAEHTDFFLPLSLRAALADPVEARGAHEYEMMARLRPGVSLEQAQAELAALSADLAAEYPRDNEGMTLDAVKLHETMMGDTRTPLLVLMASAALVLLIACANLAAALLSRTIERRREFAVRIALGADRGRLIRQLLTESLLLAVAGGAAGLLLAHAGLAALRGAGVDALPYYTDLSLDGGAVAFTFTLALITGTAFGLAPALFVGGAEPQTVLRDESRGSTESHAAGRLRGVLVACQVALCLSLLTGAGLLARSLWMMQSAPLGFNTTNVLTFTVPLSAQRYPTLNAQVAFQDELTEQIAALPGVRSIAVTRDLPTRVGNSNGVTVVGATRVPGDVTPFILTSRVSERYFETMSIPIVAGRGFARSDDVDAPPVVMVSETMAKQFWPEGNVIGSRIRVGPDPEAPPIEVIGIVRDVRTDITRADAEPMLYAPIRQGWLGYTFVVRTAADPLSHVRSIRGLLTSRDPTVPLANVTTLDDVVNEGLSPRRVPMMLMLMFGALALLLACIGIHALFANMAVARQREFGVRLALGSSRRSVAALVLRQGAFWMAAGLAGGLLGVLAVSRALRSVVYGIAPLDPVSIAVAVLALLLAATAALALPLHRATRADPLSVMR